MLELAGDRDVLERRRERISTWNVGEQMQHVALVDGGILELLEQAAPPADVADKGPTAIGRVMLLAGYIPRGKGRAPSFVLPRDVDPGGLEPTLASIRERFAALDLGRIAAGGALGRHPVFGYLDAARWLRFVDIHHHHHWKIIRDIRRAA